MTTCCSSLRQPIAVAPADIRRSTCSSHHPRFLAAWDPPPAVLLAQTVAAAGRLHWVSCPTWTDPKSDKNLRKSARDAEGEHRHLPSSMIFDVTSGLRTDSGGLRPTVRPGGGVRKRQTDARPAVSATSTAMSKQLPPPARRSVSFLAVAISASEPVSAHRFQEGHGHRVPAAIADHRVDPASWAQGSLAGPGRLPSHLRWRVDPIDDELGNERSAAVKAAADRTGRNLTAVIAAMIVRGNNIGVRRDVVTHGYRRSVHNEPAERVSRFGVGHALTLARLRWRPRTQGSFTATRTAKPDARQWYGHGPAVNSRGSA